MKKIKYWTNERDNIKVPEFKLLIDLNQLTINIKNEENKLDNLNTYLNQIEDATNKNFAEIIKNTFIYLSKNPNSSFSSAITNSKNQESFSDSKNKNLIGEKSPIYQFYLETRELLDKYKENEKDEVEKIYERMQINIPTQESYKKGDQINSLERFDGQFYIDQGKKFSDEILNKFKNQEKKCVNYLFSGEAGTSKTQTIYKIEQNIIDNLEENQELIIIKIKQTNMAVPCAPSMCQWQTVTASR